MTASEYGFKSKIYLTYNFRSPIILFLQIKLGQFASLGSPALGPFLDLLEVVSRTIKGKTFLNFTYN